MKMKELREKNLTELQDILKVKQEKLRELRFKDSNKQLKNIREIRVTRTEIARLSTVISQLTNKV